MALKRDASQQALEGETLSFPEEALPGDLAFFDDEEGKVIHVGIILGNGKIIHASGQVRIDKLDHHGIFREEDKKYSHKLRMIKRIMPGE
jgi:gamma-D-glutamyl-L-lysine dipeptidyl-peptidase